MGKNAKLKKKQKWAEEKIHLDNARKLRGICFIDPEGKEFKETIKNARKKLETSVARAMPCKIMKNCGNDASNTRKFCFLILFWKLMNPQDCVWGNSIPHHHEDHIAGNEKISLQHYNLVHKFILTPQAIKIRAAKAAMGKIGEKVRLGTWRKSQVKRRWSLQHQRTYVICKVLNWRQNTKNQKFYSEVIL